MFGTLFEIEWNNIVVNLNSAVSLFITLVVRNRQSAMKKLMMYDETCISNILI